MTQETNTKRPAASPEPNGSAALAAGVLGLRKEYDAFMDALGAVRDAISRTCPRCKSSAQVWPNQSTGKLTCHRVGCHIELYPNKELGQSERMPD